MVLDGAIVENGAIVGAGSLVSTNKTVPAGEYWAGSPAVKVRDVNPDDIAAQKSRREALLQLATSHDNELNKNGQQQYKDREQYRGKEFGIGYETHH